MLCIVPRSLFLLIFGSKWAFSRGKPQSPVGCDGTSSIFLAAERKVSAFPLIWKRKGWFLSRHPDNPQLLLLALTALHLASLMLYAKLPGASSCSLKGRASVETCTLQFVCVLVLLVRYSASRKRSHLFELCLLCFTLCDIFRTHTTWRLLAPNSGRQDSVIAILQTTATTIYGLLLGIAACSSTSEPPATKYVGIVAKESDASAISLLFLSWLNPLVSYGLKNRLSQDDVEKVEIHHNAVFQLPDGETKIVNGGSQNVGFMRQLARRMPLRIHILYLGSGFLSVLAAAVTLCQPLIIGGLVEFLQGNQNSSVGAWLVLGLFLAWVVSKSSYRQTLTSSVSSPSPSSKLKAPTSSIKQRIDSAAS